MIKKDIPKLNIDSEITFETISDKEFDTDMEELNKDLDKKMLQNRIQENESIQEAIGIGSFTVGNEQNTENVKKLIRTKINS